MTPDTQMIDMRTPATAPLPVLAPEPTWDALVRPARRGRPRTRGRDRLELVGDVAMWGGWLGLVAYVGSVAHHGGLLAQALPWGR